MNHSALCDCLLERRVGNRLKIMRTVYVLRVREDSAWVLNIKATHLLLTLSSWYILIITLNVVFYHMFIHFIAHYYYVDDSQSQSSTMSKQMDLRDEN